jgi:arsenical pump membrane protein
VLTHKLQSFGVVEIITDYLSPDLSSVGKSFFFSAFFSAVTSGVINNIPASISLSSVFFNLTQGAGFATQKAVAYGLVVGTNLGALFTPVGALATILWMNLIRKRGVVFPLKKFMIYGLFVGCFSILIAGLVIIVQLKLLT